VKIGIQLRPEITADEALAEAKIADDQGYDSVWLFDHLMNWRYSIAPLTPEMKGETRRITTEAEHSPDLPYDSFTLMTAIGAVTKNVRLGWATLNLSFRGSPAVLCKMITTLDQVTHGRVICCVGSGWYEEEAVAYNVPGVTGHAERMAYAREVIELWKELWAHPAPETVTYEGKYVQVRDLPFNPVPYRREGPPIWWGGDSDASIETVKRYCDGWMQGSVGKPEKVKEVMSSPDWPSRPMTLTRGGRILVAETRQQALEDAEKTYTEMRDNRSGTRSPNFAKNFEAFVAGAIVGSPEDCLEQLEQFQGYGYNHLRVAFNNPREQHNVARLLLPRLSELDAKVGAH
jgi:alkanesulfonate monooxygenase SsuD/methylene tetrahydromethanopterin reductase-like flavin-dependent oxidoreductase (luciferase family)